MRYQVSLATLSVLAFAVAACGGPPAETSETPDDVVAVEEGVAEPAAVADGDDVEAQVDSPEAVETADEEPTPAPTTSASVAPRPTATPTRVAAMAPPASFVTCGVCHSVERGQNGVGPSLAGVVGRKSGSVAGANYSPGMKSANVTWNAANLERYLVDPAAVVPGGTMPAPGLNAAQAKTVVEYLKTL